MKLKIKVEDQTLNSLKISKDYTLGFDIKTGHNKTEHIVLTLNKWAFEDQYEADNDWDLNEPSKAIYDELDEDLQDQIWEFINNLKL